MQRKGRIFKCINVKEENLAWFVSWPNPAIDETYFQFFINKAEHVRMDIFDLQGKHHGTLTDEMQVPGEHYIRYNTSGLTPGIYLVRMNCGSESRSIKLIVGN